MKTRSTTLLTCVGVVASVCTANAEGLTFRTRLNETLEAHSNYQLEQNPAGPTYISNSSLHMDAAIRTHTMRFAATVDLSYRTYFGPGARGLEPAFNRSYWSGAEFYDKLTTYKVDASRSIVDASQVQLEETGVSAPGGGELTTDFVRGEIYHRFSTTDTLRWTARMLWRDFASPTSDDSKDFTSTALWTHRVSGITDLLPSVTYEKINYDNETKSELTIWTGMLGVSSQLTQQLSLRGGLGFTHLALRQGSGQQFAEAFPPETFLPETFSGATSSALSGGSASAIDWVGNILVTYQVNNTNTLSFAAAQTVAPDTLGNILKNQVIGLTLNHRINHSSNLLFAGNVSHQDSANGLSDLYSALVVYNYQIAREWNFSASYNYRQRVTEDTKADSHSVLFSLSWNKTWLEGTDGEGPPAPITALSTWPAGWVRPIARTGL